MATSTILIQPIQGHCLVSSLLPFSGVLTVFIVSDVLSLMFIPWCFTVWELSWMGAFPSDLTLSTLLIGIYETSVWCLTCVPTTSLKALIRPKSFQQGRVSYVRRIMLSTRGSTLLLHYYFDFFLLSYFTLAKILSKIKMDNYWLHLIKTLFVS